MGSEEFRAWALNCSSSSSEEVPTDLLESHDASLVCKWLCCFIRDEEDGWVFISTCHSTITL